MPGRRAGRGTAAACTGCGGRRQNAGAACGERARATGRPRLWRGREEIARRADWGAAAAAARAEGRRGSWRGAGAGAARRSAATGRAGGGLGAAAHARAGTGRAASGRGKAGRGGVVRRPLAWRFAPVRRRRPPGARRAGERARRGRAEGEKRGTEVQKFEKVQGAGCKQGVFSSF